MKFLLKILGEPHNATHKTVTFGKGYTFLWNNALRAYTYEPKSQRETDEIYESQSVQKVWTFVPHVIPDAAPPVGSDAATIAKLRAAAKTDAETIAQLRADLAAQQDRAKGAKGKAKPAPAHDTDLPDV